MLSQIGHLPMNPTLAGQAEVKEHIVYSQNGQHLTLILPWVPWAAQGDRSQFSPRPLIVFIQGSGWTTPNLGYQMPMMCRYAEEGYAVAMVSHRSTGDGYPLPAFLIDVKCAIRFLRAHAAEYGIDPERVAAYGTSSGGNTACLLGLTGDAPRYITDEYPDESDAVCGVVSCFGPAHLPKRFEDMRQRLSPENHHAMLLERLGPDESKWDAVMTECSPALIASPGQKYPTFLLLHGTKDTVLSCEQLEILYESLRNAGADVRAYYVDGADHEGNFWGLQVRTVIHDALVSMLGSHPSDQTNAALQETMRQRFEREKEAKLNHFRQMNRHIKKGQTLFTGSSLMEQFPIAEFCLNEGLPIAYNRGIGGYTTDDFLSAIHEMLLDPKPAKLFINIGTNDMNPRPDGEDWLSHLSANYRKIAEIIRDQLPGTQVYMMAYYPANLEHPTAKRSPWMQNRTNANIDRANTMVAALVKEFGFQYIDVNDGLKDAQGSLKMEYTVDGIHMTPEAYYTVFERLRPYLE